MLAQEILPEMASQLPVFVAGGIGRGELIAGYLEMGAAGVQLGTRFACAVESIAHPNFKKAFFRPAKKDAEQLCEPCHQQYGIKLPPNHPPKYRCLFCHKLVK